MARERGRLGDVVVEAIAEFIASGLGERRPDRLIDSFGSVRTQGAEVEMPPLGLSHSLLADSKSASRSPRRELKLALSPES